MKLSKKVIKNIDQLLKKRNKNLNKTDDNDKILELVKKGKKQKYITQEDILCVFPDAETHLLELDELYDKLLKAKIDVFESVSEDEEKKQEKSQASLKQKR